MRARKPPELIESAKLPLLQKRALYAVSALLWISGACLLLRERRGRLQRAESRPGSPAELHGAAAMAFLLVFGALLPQHLPNGWHQKCQRPSGLTLVLVCAILMLTG
jgi:hypothetical protein